MTTLVEYETDGTGQRITPRATARPVAEAATARRKAEWEQAEQSRLARRAFLKGQRVESQMSEVDLAKVDQVIADKINEKEILGSEHVATMAPIQARFEAVKQQRIALAVDSLPSNPDLENELDSLDQQRREHTAALRQSISRINILLYGQEDEPHHLAQAPGGLAAERVAIAKKCNRSLLDNELYQTSSRDAQLTVQLAADDLRWYSARLNSAIEKHSLRPSALYAEIIKRMTVKVAEAQAAEVAAMQAAINE